MKNETYERNKGVLKKLVVLVSVHYLKAKNCTFIAIGNISVKE